MLPSTHNSLYPDIRDPRRDRLRRDRLVPCSTRQVHGAVDQYAVLSRDCREASRVCAWEACREQNSTTILRPEDLLDVTGIACHLPRWPTVHVRAPYLHCPIFPT